MTQQVTFAVNAQQKAAIDAFLQIGQAVDAVAAKGNRAGQTMAQGANDAGSAWDKGLKILQSYPVAFGKMMTGAAGVYAIIGQVRAEFERLRSLQEKAMTGLDEAQDPYYKLRQSVGPEYSKSAELQAMIKRGMQDYGSETPVGYLELAANMQSARGEMGETATMKAVNVAAKLRGVMNMPQEDAAQFGGAMIDAANVQRAQGRNYSPEQVAGKFLSMFGVTRSTSIGEFARYDMRTINTMARHGFSMDEAIGFQSAIAGSKPDPMGRISATGMGLLTGDIAKAYAVAEGSRHGIPGVSSQQFEKSGMNMFDVARSDTKTGHFIQAYLYGIRAMNPKAVALAKRTKGMGPDFTGHARGESGMFELSRELLDPNAELYGRAKEASSRVVSDAGAEGHYKDVVDGKAGNRLEQYYKERAMVRGAIAVAKFGQVQKAEKGGIVSMQSELSELLGKGATAQGLVGALTSINTIGATDEELRAQKMGIIKGGINDIYVGAAGRAFRSKYGSMAEYDPGGNTPVSRQDIESSITADERNLLEALNRLIEAISSQRIEVTVQDPTGRDVGRATSRPRAVEGLNNSTGPQSGGATSSW